MPRLPMPSVSRRLPRRRVPAVRHILPHGGTVAPSNAPHRCLVGAVTGDAPENHARGATAC